MQFETPDLVEVEDPEGGIASYLPQIYTARFDDDDAAKKDAIWRQITRYLQRFVPEDATVLDIGCDRGYFIRNIQAAEKWAADLGGRADELGEQIKFVQSDGLRLDTVIPTSHFDTVFMSNYLEHLRSRDDVIRQLRVVRELLRPGGRALILQPNIRFTGARYWDFIDHHTALTDASLAEAGELAGLRTVKLVPRFLPYTTKSRKPQHPLLVRAYLAFPPAWKLLGQQALFIAERP